MKLIKKNKQDKQTFEKKLEKKRSSDPTPRFRQGGSGNAKNFSSKFKKSGGGSSGKKFSKRN